MFEHLIGWLKGETSTASTSVLLPDAASSTKEEENVISRKYTTRPKVCGQSNITPTHDLSVKRDLMIILVVDSSEHSSYSSPQAMAGYSTACFAIQNLIHWSVHSC